jgi:hypothetical protein
MIVQGRDLRYRGLSRAVMQGITMKVKPNDQDPTLSP